MDRFWSRFIRIKSRSLFTLYKLLWSTLYWYLCSYSGTTINTDDEFPLHCSGYTQLDRGRIFAKIAAVQGATKLMLAAQKPETNIPLFTIKIKQIAIL